MKKIVCLSILVFILSVAVSADFDATDFDRDTRKINISGNIGQGNENRLLTVVLECDGNIADMRQVRADSEADFECSFKIADVSGTYKILYQTPKSSEYVATSITVYSLSEINEALTAFKSAKTTDDIKSACTNYDKVLGLSEELLDQMKENAGFYEAILDKAPNIKIVKDIDDLVCETAIVQLFNTADPSEKEELMRKYMVLTGISESKLFVNYTSFENKEINAFKAKFDTYKFSEVEDILNAFEVCVVLTEIQYANYYTVTQQMIEEYYDRLSLDMTEFDNLKAKKDVYKKLTGCDAENGKAFQEKFGAAVEAVLNNKSGGSSGNGGSSGGGGGGSSSKNDGVKDVPLFVEPEIPVNVEVVSFMDLEGVPWAKDAIISLANKGVINGKTQYGFYPNDNTTRAEFVKILVGALGFEMNNTQKGFRDVSSDSWAYPYICAGVEYGIVNGYGNGMFGPEDNITRQDMVTMVMRAMDMKNKTDVDEKYELNFEDTVLIDSYALENVKSAVSLGIINGTGDNLFSPDALTTRAEAAVLIYRCTQKLLVD